MKAFPSVLFFLLISGSSGCSTISYLWQAGRGQMAFFQHARPISEVVADERTSPRVRALLSEVSEIKKWGESFGLKPTHNYQEYVHLDRPAAVWVVSASERFRFNAKTWNFPVVGSFTYLGWFDRTDALAHAERLKIEGWDTDVRGASAYSTLGWFRDPILSTMLGEGEFALPDLVNVVLHESVHATLYIKGQSTFNESLADFVADRLTLLWMKQKGKTSLMEAWNQAQALGEAKRKAFHEAYVSLDRVYTSGAQEQEMAARKSQILNGLREQWKISREITNATLIQFKTYETGHADFDWFFDQCENDWERIWRALGRLAPASFRSPQADQFRSTLEALVREGC